jgi:hypothetical protein
MAWCPNINVINLEQEYYDNLNKLSIDKLVKKERELLCSSYNIQLERQMVRNILINRGYDLNKLDNTVKVYYHCFMENTPEENKKYGFINRDV